MKFVVREGEEEWRLIITRYHGFGSGRNDRVIEVIRFVIHFFFYGRFILSRLVFFFKEKFQEFNIFVICCSARRSMFFNFSFF